MDHFPQLFATEPSHGQEHQTMSMLDEEVQWALKIWHYLKSDDMGMINEQTIVVKNVKGNPSHSQCHVASVAISLTNRQQVFLARSNDQGEHDLRVLLIQDDIHIVASESTVHLGGDQYFGYCLSKEMEQQRVIDSFVHGLSNNSIDLVIVSGQIPNYCQQRLQESNISFIYSVSAIDFYNLSSVCCSLPIAIKLSPDSDTKDAMDLNPIFIGRCVCSTLSLSVKIVGCY